MPDQSQTQDRRQWMATLARASAERLTALLRAAPPLPAYAVLRGPETGLVMVRGRMGGGGDPFNMGEMTVTRCTVRTDAGVIGHAWIAGRNAEHAELAAAVDAGMQDKALAPALQEAVLDPLDAEEAARRAAIAARAAATRVDFFTLATMRSSEGRQ
jgi:alpha-D-ribose 1-methylphosphonate 5-triphosphate synthase subunit PhnG